MLNSQQHGVPFKGTHTHATAATISIAAVAGKRHYITDIMVQSDKDGAVLLVKQGSTTIWQATLKTVATGLNVLSHSFATPIIGDLGAAVSIAIDATGIGEVNIAGYTN